MRTRTVPWWQVYTIVAVMFGLLILEHSTPLAVIPLQLADAIILAFALGLVAFWLSHNRQALQQEGVSDDEMRRSLVVKIYERGMPINISAQLAGRRAGADAPASDQTAPQSPDSLQVSQDWRRN